MHKYYLNEIANKYNIPESTIRYYDSKGILIAIKRDENNYRYMLEEDLETLKIVICLKQTGMELKDIKHYLDLVKQGDSTIDERYEMILSREIETKKQIKNFEEQLDYLQYKKNYYQSKIK